MIQRVQSIFLAVSFLLFSLAFAIIFNFSEQNPMTFAIDTDVKELIKTKPLLLIYYLYPRLILVLCIFLSFLSIFLFKNRKKQLFISSFLLFFSFLALFIILGSIFLRFTSQKPFLDWLYQLVLVDISIVSIFLARRKIKQDEALVKSIDRIR